MRTAYSPPVSGNGTAVAEPPQTPKPPSTQAPKVGYLGTSGILPKVSFGRIAAKKEDTKTAYPVFPDANGQAGIIAARIIERSEQFDALKGALETDKAELKMLVSPYYFQCNHGRHEVPSSVGVQASACSGEVLVCYQNRYSQLPDEHALLPVLGDRTGRFFRQAFELKVSGDKLPEAKTQELLDELQELFARHGCLEALEVKSGIKPTKEFHAARHLQLTPAENLALDQVCPIIAMVKTKGRK